MARIEKATGRCLCGAVAFEAKDVKTRYGVCHCGMCRRWTGGPFPGVEAPGGVTYSGEENIGLYRGSDWGERGFCKTCGSTLFWRAQDGSHLVLPVGAFDDQEPFELVSEIFIDKKPPGYAFAGEHKTMTEAEVFAMFAPPADGGEQP